MYNFLEWCKAHPKVIFLALSLLLAFSLGCLLSSCKSVSTYSVTRVYTWTSKAPKSIEVRQGQNSQLYQPAIVQAAK